MELGVAITTSLRAVDAWILPTREVNIRPELNDPTLAAVFYESQDYAGDLVIRSRITVPMLKRSNLRTSIPARKTRPTFLRSRSIPLPGENHGHVRLKIAGPKGVCLAGARPTDAEYSPSLVFQQPVSEGLNLSTAFIYLHYSNSKLRLRGSSSGRGFSPPGAKP